MKLSLALAAILFAACGSSTKKAPDHAHHHGDGSGSGSGSATEPAMVVNATVEARSNSNVSGSLRFEKVASGIQVTGKISGLGANTEHGFHIHETGDCSAPDAKSAGGHFNPHGANHGARDAATRHAGDLGNLKADANGNAELQFVTTGISLTSGDVDYIGNRSVIVHEKADDFATQPTGNAGARIGCGVIR